MDIAHIDFETYSELDVSDVGAYRYAEEPTTEVLMLGWAIGMGPVHLWLPWRQAIPARLAEHVAAGGLLGAHNAQFERAIWHGPLRRLHPRLPPTSRRQYVCTAVLAAASGMPRSLEMAAKAANVAQQKDMEGEKLKKMFCFPRKPTKADPRTRILPMEEWESFQRFGEYCKQDVRGERDLHATLPPLHPLNEQMYVFDLEMNERGLPIDIPLVRKANVVVGELERRAAYRVEKTTGGIRPTQVAKIRDWFISKGLELPNLQKDTVAALLVRDDAAADDDKMEPEVREALELRVESGKASTKKLARMLMATCSDYRARGMFMFHGAHTGRYSGKIIQPHNFIRGLLKLKQQGYIFWMLEHVDPDMFEAIFDDPINMISQCMRGFIAAPNGGELHVADYSAIEARILAWLAGEQWVLDAYAKGYDPYKIMASYIFNMRYEDIGDDSEERRIGKNAVLGCGYGLGAEKFVAYCEKIAGVIITFEFAQRVVYEYRNRNKKTMALHGKVESAAIRAVREERQESNPITVGMLQFYLERAWLCIRLPSGRVLRYFTPRIIMIDRWGNGRLSPQLSYRVEFHKHMVWEQTYGGKLVENVTQAVAYDVMSVGMVRAKGYAPVIGTVHDEILTELKPQIIVKCDVKDLEHTICDIGPWAKGIPLTAKGFVCQPRYRKG